MVMHQGTVAILRPTPGLGAETRMLSYDEIDADEYNRRDLGARETRVGLSSGLNARVDAIALMSKNMSSLL